MGTNKEMNRFGKEIFTGKTPHGGGTGKKPGEGKKSPDKKADPGGSSIGNCISRSKGDVDG